ncbi:MAG TPA: aminotransferase class I/II-fold pyridoxal phosphate-dependent enzyme, partial [Chlamydiales bacterium]|nr:aminotransferase class I/II-fold pyridoxal phosphate-dependent enzyme [Chlamydiales bacterium]
EICHARNLIPFFDLAYQGFGNGLDEDVQAIRLFAKEHHPMLVATSFSKNLGLYGERVGTLLVLSPKACGVESHLKAIARASYSNPPLHGALVAAHTLLDADLRSSWQQELKEMRERITSMRNALASALSAECKSGDFSYLTKRNGMFCYLNLTPEQIEDLKLNQAIYLTQSGRVNVTGLNTQNIPYVAQSIARVVG